MEIGFGGFVCTEHISEIQFAYCSYTDRGPGALSQVNTLRQNYNFFTVEVTFGTDVSFVQSDQLVGGSDCLFAANNQSGEWIQNKTCR